MHDPKWVRGLSERLAGVMEYIASETGSPVAMTPEHVHMLMAYKDKPGVKEDFDKRFGDGMAAKILETTSEAHVSTRMIDAAMKLVAAVDAFAKTQRNSDDDVSKVIAAVRGMSADVAGALSSHAEAMKQATPKPVDVSALTAGVADQIARAMAPVIAAQSKLSSEMDALRRAMLAPRTVITDRYGDIVGIKVDDTQKSS